MADPIPLDVARRRRKKVQDDLPPEDDQDQVEQCPVIALGHCDGKFYFLDTAGQQRALTARALGSRSELTALFVGHREWLETMFKQRRTIKEMVGGETVISHTEVGFNAADAAAFLMREAGAAGIFGPHIPIRHPGIWRDAEGRPAVHCGDAILIGGTWRNAGARIDGTIWVSGPPLPRPDRPCGPDVGRAFQEDLQRLWTFRSPAGAIICAGMVGTGLLGAAPSWRPNAFLRAEPGSGKTLLMEAMRACAPVHHHTNDTSAAGVLGAMNGKAMQVFIDEPTDRVDQEGAQKLMDLVLAASGGEGVKGFRGTVDGGVRTIQMIGSFVYGAVSTPELQAQHLRRITMVDLVKPGAGEDHRKEMEALAARMRSDAARLWGRMLAHWPEWLQAEAAYRNTLAAAGCAAGEMDQMAAILAGWWIMTEDGVPNARDARVGVTAVQDFVRVAEDVAEDSGPRRVVEMLMSARVQYDGSTRQEQIGALLERAFERNISGYDVDSVQRANECLGRYGIRVICAKDEQSRQGRAIPRAADGDGIWLLPGVVRGLFNGSRFEGTRWQIELMRLPTARPSGRLTVQVGGVRGKPFWLGRADLDPAEPIGFGELLKQLDGIKPAELLAMIDHYGDRFPTVQRFGLVHSGWLFDLGVVTTFVNRMHKKAPPD